MNIVDLLIYDREEIQWNEVVLNDQNRGQLDQLLREFRYIEKLREFNLPVNNKVLLYGPSGCGKTMTARALASALNRSLFVLDLSYFVSSRIGETAKNMRAVFEKAEREKAVLLLDEFDYVGKERGSDEQDVGEMRRIVNALIQQIDHFSDRALLVAATNHIEVIDPALLRRFQLRIQYDKPSRAVLDAYYDHLLESFPEEVRNIPRKYELSFAEARDYAYTLVKGELLNLFEKYDN